MSHAAVALYRGLALVLAHQVRRTWLKATCRLLVLVPLAVAVPGSTAACTTRATC